MINIFKKKKNFIERSVMGALSFFKESIFSEEYASRKGFLQSLDPRIKLLVILLFLLSAIMLKNIIFLAFMYVFCLLLAYFSRINLLFFLKRTWVFIPLFSLFIALPALFNIFTPGEPLLVFGLLGLKLIITRPGLNGALLFVARVVTTVSLVILLSLTTRHTQLLKVLRIFKIPSVFVLTLMMCYRYVYLFVEIIENTYLAIKSRVGRSIHYKKGREIVSWSMAALWQRSYQLNNEVYNAMLSRGYRGEPAILDDFKTRAIDWIWLSFAAIIFLLAVYNGYNG